MAIPVGGAAQLGIPVGMAFTTGIAFATTTGAADANTGAVAVDEVIVSYCWK